ncbi:MAG: FHA domain-containing protein, partial [Polyangiaceae bacterium]
PPPAAAPAPAPSPMAATAQPQYGVDPTKSRVLRGFLVAYGINPLGDFWALTSGRHVLGRLGADQGVDISLQDPTISSRHAALAVDPNTGNITLEDTGSTNGTFVNDEHIGFNGRRDLRDGDRLRFGGYTTIVKIIGRI